MLSENREVLCGRLNVWTAPLGAADLPTFSASQIFNPGDIIYNQAPAGSGIFAWQCMTGGSNPTFASVSFTGEVSAPANGLTAFAGGGQTGALPLTADLNRVTTVATAADSVKLPQSVAGMSITVINAAAANAMNVFPFLGDAINALSANTAISVAANKTITFYCVVAGTWNSLLTA